MVLRLPVRLLSGGVEAVGGGRVGDVPVAAASDASSAGVVGLEEAAVVVVQGVKQHLRLVLEVVREPPVRPANKGNHCIWIYTLNMHQQLINVVLS